MKIARAAIVALTVSVITWSNGAAKSCDLSDFDNGMPNGTVDMTNRTQKTYFKWGSDVDSLNERDRRSWHYIKNLHNKPLSARWDNVGITIPFNNPLGENLTICSFDYGGEKDFRLDRESPILTSNDGKKNAIAYVKKIRRIPTEFSKISGVEMRANYLDKHKQLGTAQTRLILYHFPQKRLFRVVLFAQPSGTSMAIRPLSWGIRSDDVKRMMSSQGVDIISESPLQKMVRDEFTLSGLKAIDQDGFVRLSTKKPISLIFFPRKRLFCSIHHKERCCRLKVSWVFP